MQSHRLGPARVQLSMLAGALGSDRASCPAGLFYAGKQRKQGNATRFECPRPVWVGRRPSTGPASCNDMLLAGNLACKSKASCGQVLAGKKPSARIWSKTVRFLCCRIKNLSAGWPPSCCQVLAAWQKQGKARKAKTARKLRQKAPDTPAKPPRGPRIPRQWEPPGMARKLWQKAPAQRRGPGSTGKATQGAPGSTSKPTGGASRPQQSHPGGARNHRQKFPGGQGTTGKSCRI